ncbi:MAG: polysaccharide deacetylase family protein [Kiritimatiellae bacterium]|nr:polysaccharide deacetylase family protein [Kiritimatiellia bacterium]
MKTLTVILGGLLAANASAFDLSKADWCLHLDPGGAKSLAQVEQLAGPAWQPVRVGKFWHDQGMGAEPAADAEPGTDVAWYRCEFQLPAALAGESLLLCMGAVDDLDTTFLNGRKVGETGKDTKRYWSAPRRYPVDRSVLRDTGPNVLLVRVVNLRDKGGISVLPVELLAEEAIARHEARIKAFNPLNLRLYTQEVVIVYASADEAAAAELAIAPLPGDKTWAFSGRWDDCNWEHLQMKKRMQTHGYKATFYLNSGVRQEPFGLSRFIAEPGRKLCADGFSLGGHGLRHRSLPNLDRNELLFEIAADRINIEQVTDRPVNSFCFAGSGYGQRHDRATRADVAEAVIRAGYHHTPTPIFARTEPGNASVLVSTVNLIAPGDKEADPGKFDWQLRKVLSDPRLREANPNLTVGIHVWHTDEGWSNLEKSLAKYAGNPDWWYCNQTEYAAYRYQSLHNRLEKSSTAGARAAYRLTRPLPGSLGGDVPLTVRIRNARVNEAFLAGAPLAVKRDDARVLVGVPNDPDAGLPQRIDHIENADNSAAPAAAHVSGDFEGVCFFAHADEAAGTLELLARNDGPAPLDRIVATLRLPLLYTDGVRYAPLEDLAPGASKRYSLALGPRREEPLYRRGRAYYVAQIDFRLNGVPGRIYATTRCRPGEQAK